VSATRWIVLSDFEDDQTGRQRGGEIRSSVSRQFQGIHSNGDRASAPVWPCIPLADQFRYNAAMVVDRPVRPEASPA
jgi:hypothetical protein